MKNLFISKTILAIILLIIGFVPAMAFANPTQLDSVIATVGEEAITLSDLEEFTKHIVKQQPDLRPGKEFYLAALENMINIKLQLQAAKRLNITTPNDQLDKIIQSIAESKKQTVSEMKVDLEKSGLNFNTFRDHVKNEVTVEKLKQAFVSHKVFISAKEIEAFMHSYTGAASIGIEYSVQQVLIPENSPAAESIAKSIVEKLKNGVSLDITTKEHEVTPGTSETANASLATSIQDKTLDRKLITAFPEIFTPIILTLKLGEVSTPIKTANGFYVLKLLHKNIANLEQNDITKLHIRHILLKPSDNLSVDRACERLSALKEQIEKEHNFDALAKANSEDFGSASTGGDIGWVTSDVLDPAFYASISQLKVNEISEPFKSSFGWHIAEILEIKVVKSTDDAIMQKAHQILYKRKADEIIQSLITQFRDDTFVKIILNDSDIDLLKQGL